jgi:hypothetical protein
MLSCCSVQVHPQNERRKIVIGQLAYSYQSKASYLNLNIVCIVLSEAFGVYLRTASGHIYRLPYFISYKVYFIRNLKSRLQWQIKEGNVFDLRQN